MVQLILLWVGAGLTIVWGLAHVAATRPVVSGFGQLSLDNRRILMMEWIAEGLALCFVGAVAIAVTLLAGPGAPGSALVYRSAAGFLFVLAALASVTGARTAQLPFRLCPFVEAAGGVLLLVGSLS